VLPDLRYSALLGSTDAWGKTVLEGTHVGSGMPGFAAVMKPEHAELVRAWIVARANETQAPGAPAPAPEPKVATKPAK
jgi:hypothetical protein